MNNDKTPDACTWRRQVPLAIEGIECRRRADAARRGILAMRYLLAIAVATALLTTTLSASAEESGAAEYASVIRATPDREHGKQIFQEKCAPCHGARGEGYPGGDVAAFPIIGGQHFKFLALALVRFRHGHSSVHHMQYFSNAARLPAAQDIADVTAYVAALQPGSPVGVGSGLSLDEGARVYLRACEPCHRATGAGDAVRPVPRLAGQHYRYLLRQLDAPAAPHRSGDAHSKRIQQISASDRAAVADYLSRLLPAAPNGG
jgi:cytochrome c553